VPDRQAREPSPARQRHRAIFTSKQGLFLQTIYHPLRLYAEHTLDTALDVYVDGPLYDLPPGQEDPIKGRVHHVSDLGPFSLLDATAPVTRRRERSPWPW
jgi:alpha-N-arabinofuranosidase